MKTSFQLKTLVHLCAAATLTTAAAAAAGAPMAQTSATDVTRGAVAVTTTMGQFDSDFAVSHLIDQSGLASSYFSGVTSFDSYVTNASHDSTDPVNFWYSVSGATGFLSFDLGAAYNIDGLALFGIQWGDPARVSGIKVYADNDSDATNGNAGLLFDSGTFDSDNTKPNVFSFSSAANTRYLNIEIVSNDGASLSGLGEVVFRESLAAPVAAVPEPGTYALMGLGLLAIGVMQRRRAAQR